ncbi:MAG: transposase [Dehalococcoidia bacterium]
MSQSNRELSQQAEALTRETRSYVHQVRAATRRKYTPEEKIRIVLEGFRREVTVNDLCRLYGKTSTMHLTVGEAKEFIDALTREHPDLDEPEGRRWLAAQSLSSPHRQLVDLLSSQADGISQGVTEIEENLRRAFEEHPILARLLSVPGFGFLTAATFLAEVGDVDRFPRARHLVSYLGLAPRVRASGGHVRIGNLTKEGPPLIRSYLVQAVQNATRSPGPCQDLYLRVRQRSGPQAARVAVARKLAIMAYLAWRFPKEVTSRE